MMKQWIVMLVLGMAVFGVGAQDRGLTVVAQAVTGSEKFNPGKQFALIIGVDKYAEWPSLRGAVDEAKRVKDVLARRYFIDEFIEVYDQDATSSSIRRLFAEELPKKLGINDSLLIFYSGHGYLDSSKTGFWIASDGSKDVYDQRGWIPNAQLRNYISQLKAQRILVVADACFSGDFLNTTRGALPEVDNAYLRKALQLTARQVLSSGSSETVPDDSEFGTQLLNLLERNTETVLDPVSIYDRIRRGVTKTEPLFGTMPGHEQGAVFGLFLRPDSTSAAVPAAASTTPVPTTLPLALPRVASRAPGPSLFKTLGWVGWGTAAVGTVAAVATYFLGQDAYAKYRASTDAQATAGFRDSVSSMSSLFVLSAVGAGLGAGTGLTFTLLDGINP